MTRLKCLICLGAVFTILEVSTQLFVLGRPVTIEDDRDVPIQHLSTNPDEARSASWNTAGSIQSSSIPGLTPQETSEVVNRILDGQLQPIIAQPIDIGDLKHTSKSTTLPLAEEPLSVLTPFSENTRTGKYILTEQPNQRKVMFEAISLSPVQPYHIYERPVVLEVLPNQDISKISVLRDPIIGQSPVYSDKIIGSAFIEAPVNTVPIRKTVYLEPVTSIQGGRDGEVVIQGVRHNVINIPTGTSQILSGSLPFIASTNSNRPITQLLTLNEDLSNLNGYSNINKNGYDASASSGRPSEQNLYSGTSWNSFEEEPAKINNATDEMIAFPPTNEYYNSDRTQLISSKDTVYPLNQYSLDSNVRVPRFIDFASVSSAESSREDEEDILKLIESENLSESEEDQDNFKKSIVSSEEMEPTLNLPSTMSLSSLSRDNFLGMKNGNEESRMSEVDLYPPQPMGISQGLDAPINLDVPSLPMYDFVPDLPPNVDMNDFFSEGLDPLQSAPPMFGFDPGLPPPMGISQDRYVPNSMPWPPSMFGFDPALPLPMDISQGLNSQNNFNTPSPVSVYDVGFDNSEEKLQSQRNISGYDGIAPKDNPGIVDDSDTPKELLETHEHLFSSENMDDTKTSVEGKTKETHDIFSNVDTQDIEETLHQTPNLHGRQSNAEEEISKMFEYISNPDPKYTEERNSDDEFSSITEDSLKVLEPLLNPHTEESEENVYPRPNAYDDFSKFEEGTGITNLDNPNQDSENTEVKPQGPKIISSFDEVPLLDYDNFDVVTDKPLEDSMQNSEFEDNASGAISSDNTQKTSDTIANLRDKPVLSLEPADYETQSSEDKVQNRRRVGDFLQDESVVAPLNFDAASSTNDRLDEAEQVLKPDSSEDSEDCSISDLFSGEIATEFPEIFDTPIRVTTEPLELLEPNFDLNQQPGYETIHDQMFAFTTTSPINGIEGFTTTETVSEAQTESDVYEIPGVYSLDLLNDEVANFGNSGDKFRQATQKRSVTGDILPRVEKSLRSDLEKLNDDSNGVKPERNDDVNIPQTDTRIIDIKPEIFTTDEPLLVEEKLPMEYAVLTSEAAEPHMQKYVETIPDPKRTDLLSVSTCCPPPNQLHSVRKKDNPFEARQSENALLPAKTNAKTDDEIFPTSKSNRSSISVSQTTSEPLTTEDTAQNTSEYLAKDIVNDMVASQATLKDDVVVDHPIQTQTTTTNGTAAENLSDETIIRRRRSNGEDPTGVHASYDSTNFDRIHEQTTTTVPVPNAVLISSPATLHPFFTATIAFPPTTTQMPPSTNTNSSSKPTVIHVSSTTSSNYTHKPLLDNRPTSPEPLPTPLPETTSTSHPSSTTTSVSTNSTVPKKKKKKQVWKIPFIPNNIVIDSNGATHLEPKDNLTSNSFLAGRRSLISKPDDGSVESARRRLFRRLQSRRPNDPVSDAALIERNRYRRPQVTVPQFRAQNLPTLPPLTPSRPKATDDVLGYLTAEDPSKLPTTLYNSPEEREEARKRRFRTMVGLAGDVRSLMADRAKKAMGTFAHIVGGREGDNKRSS